MPKGRKKPQKKINTEFSFSDTPIYLPAMGSVDFPNDKLYWHHSSDGVLARILPNLFLNPSKFWLPQNTQNNEFQFSCALSENPFSLLVINQIISLCEMWKAKQVKALMKNSEQSLHLTFPTQLIVLYITIYLLCQSCLPTMTRPRLFILRCI